MDLQAPLLQLPIRFCADTLAEEVRALPSSAWVPHPQGFAGNDAVPLVSPGGELTDSVKGPMTATEHLRRCPYIMALMAELGAVWGRSRLMGLAPQAEVRAHVDMHYYWRTHVRIHIPILTNPGVRFTCGGETVHMAAGDCWVFDSFQLHDVQNSGSERRVHLVVDTVGGEHLWDLIKAAESGVAPPAAPWKPDKAENKNSALLYERSNIPDLMSPWEIRCHIDFLARNSVADPMLDPVLQRLDRFTMAWEAAWVRFGDGDQGLPAYRDLIDAVRDDLAALPGSHLALHNHAPLYPALDELIFRRAVVAGRDAASNPVRSTAPASPVQQPAPSSFRDQIERPVFIVSLPRSGSSLLFETLTRAPGLFTVGGESHGLIESIEELSPAAHSWHSNRLTANEAKPETIEQLARSFYGQLRDRDGHRPQGRARMLEKTPKNALRVPFLDAAWPDADFVYLVRDARQTLSSMIEAWASGRFRTYPGLPGWDGTPWSLLLVPGWRGLSRRSIPEIVAEQWKTTTNTLLSDLGRIPERRLKLVLYDDLVSSPQATIERLADSLGLGWDLQLGSDLPYSKHTVSRPSPEKWRAIEQVIEGIWPIVAEADAAARSFVERFRA